MSTVSPAVPHSLNQLGISRKTVEDLALKVLYLSGELSLYDLARQLRLRLGIALELFEKFRREQLCEVTGMDGDVHRIRITSQGRLLALELLSLNQYTGPAPVSWTDYLEGVRSQTVRALQIDPENVSSAFSHLVLNSDTIVQIGTAITSGKSVFLYGPTGTGKSSIAEAMANVFRQHHVRIPYAVELEGQIISVYDAVVHRAVDEPDPKTADSRWVLCERPRILVGGELTVEMLDLQFDPAMRFYAAPVQMKANNGLLIVDDFGRQRLRPEQLLNRWIVPLDRRIDFLTMAGGRKIEVPFDIFVVFATNLDPTQLVDAAFLRRINTKIKIDAVTPEQFHEIFRRVCSETGLNYEASVVSQLITWIASDIREPLRPCYPRDLVQQICWAATYRQTKPELNSQTLGQACRNYFMGR